MLQRRVLVIEVQWNSLHDETKTHLSIALQVINVHRDFCNIRYLL